MGRCIVFKAYWNSLDYMFRFSEYIYWPKINKQQQQQQQQKKQTNKQKNRNTNNGKKKYEYEWHICVKLPHCVKCAFKSTYLSYLFLDIK